MGTRVGRKLFWYASGILSFECPGCDMTHAVSIERQREGGPLWTWNGSGDEPVFHPSVLTRYDHMSEEGRQRNKDFYAEHGRYMTSEELPYDLHEVCHMWVGCNGAQPGQIKFLDDCTHSLAGMVVEIPDYED